MGFMYTVGPTVLGIIIAPEQRRLDFRIPQAQR